MLTAITGINWGDEGKGRMVDLLSRDYDVVVRYQGGNNAGHTVVNSRGSFILNLIPSGIFHENVVNIMGNGMVIDLHHLCGEIENLRKGGIKITPDHLKISERAIVCMPFHIEQDCLEEARLADKKYGSTRRGIAYVYGDKYMKKGVRMGDLLHMDTLLPRLKDLVEWKNLTLQKVYGADPIDFENLRLWLEENFAPVKDFVCDTSQYLDQAAKNGRNILFEAQLGALRDIDFGIYPYTSSSSTIAAYAPVGAGVPNHRLDHVIGIVKAYSSCVGEGPFTCEMFGADAEELRKAGGEYGAATGRPRRVGGFDAVASRYGTRIQGATSLALTKLDILSYMEEIPVCIAYEVDGKTVRDFPFGQALERAKPVYTYMKGWQCDISGCRKACDLPEAARQYIRFIEKELDCPIQYVSVGADREAYLVME